MESPKTEDRKIVISDETTATDELAKLALESADAPVLADLIAAAAQAQAPIKTKRFDAARKKARKRTRKSRQKNRK